eukprot:gnl/MRDRNA2_/MRDRNA2_93983_c0_seq1.p1 gnl/MRDRNA2_/MRDRNA2_93983_c0~~gnl/MRDRNA2_/MRDRNA2_93983_c0_seq1.p1  ORF type:complete len:306 (-),score=36.33 gnl/MRDRNA2_/MRDRNA2_93983_c0_seq1:74-991(-)
MRSTTNAKYSKYNTRYGDLYGNDKREPATWTLVLVPWLIFVTGIILFSFLYTIFPVVVWLILLGCLLYALRLMVMGAWGGRVGTMMLGASILLACVLSAAIGLQANKKYLDEYWRLQHGNTYSNVLPSEPAMSHDDASVLIFTEGTILDTNRASGYQTPGRIHCVAPILNALDFDGLVEYWAVGTNCCHARGDFTCNDALDPNARSGVVLGIYPGPVRTTSPPTSLSVDHADATVLLRSNEDLATEWVPAIRAAEATFGVVAAERALLVRWSADPSQQEFNLLKAALILLIGAVFVHLLVSCFAG